MDECIHPNLIRKGTFKMKVKVDCNKCRDKQREDLMYEVFSVAADSIASGITAVAITALEHEGFDEKQIKKFYEDFRFFLETSEIFGKKITAEEQIPKIEERYGIDINNIKVNIESKTRFHKRYNRKDD